MAVAARAEMSARVQFDVLGTPAAKGSPRPVVRGGRAFLTPSHSASGQRKLATWDGNVRDQARRVIGNVQAPPFVNTPLLVEIEFRMARPVGHWSKKAGGGLVPSAPIAPASKPDIDKLARSTLDALIGIVFDDDARIVCLIARKVYANPGHEGARIDVHEWIGG